MATDTPQTPAEQFDALVAKIIQSDYLARLQLNVVTESNKAGCCYGRCGWRRAKSSAISAKETQCTPAWLLK